MEIQKLGYSVNPWRLVDSKGRQIACNKNLTTQDGECLNYETPISGRTKAECTKNALSLLENLFDHCARENAALRPPGV